MYKLIAIDLDGTLLNTNKEISIENYTAINAALRAGLKIVLATGREIEKVAPYLEYLALDLPIVTLNGAEIWTNSSTLYKRSLIDLDMVKEVYSLAKSHSIPYWGFAVEGTFHKFSFEGKLEHFGWLKFLFQTESNGQMNELVVLTKKIRALNYFEITNSHLNNIELNSQGVSKAAAIQELCDLHNICMKEVVAIGDSINDISLLKSAGLGVAMLNAQELVKKEVSMVTSSNNDNGVAEVIEFIIEKNKKLYS